MSEQERYCPVRVRPVTRADSVIYPLSAWVLALTALGIPGVVIAAVLLPAGTTRLLAQCVLVAAMLTDASSLYLTVTFLLRGGGLHGMPVITAAFYVVFVIFGMSGAWWWRPIALAGLFALYVSCLYFLPPRIARRLGWRRQGS